MQMIAIVQVQQLGLNFVICDLEPSLSFRSAYRRFAWSRIWSQAKLIHANRMPSHRGRFQPTSEWLHLGCAAAGILSHSFCYIKLSAADKYFKEIQKGDLKWTKDTFVRMQVFSV